MTGMGQTRTLISLFVWVSFLFLDLPSNISTLPNNKCYLWFSESNEDPKKKKAKKQKEEEKIETNEKKKKKNSHKKVDDFFILYKENGSLLLST